MPPRQEGTKGTILILISGRTELERDDGKLCAPQHRESGHEPTSPQIQGLLHAWAAGTRVLGSSAQATTRHSVFSRCT